MLVPPAATAPSSSSVHARPNVTVQPAANSLVATAFPTIALSLGANGNLNPATLRMTVDGVDVSRDASVGVDSLAYIPRHGLSLGTHVVSIDLITGNGAPLHEQWSFSTTLSAIPSVGTSDGGFYSTFGAIQLSVSGNIFGPNQDVPVQLIAPSGGAAYAFECNSPYQYPMYASFSSSYYETTLQSPWTNRNIECPITAMWVSPNGNVYYAPYPVYVTFEPNTAYPAPSATPVRIAPGPVQTRRPNAPATASPRPIATAHPENKPVYHAPIRLTPQPRPTP